MGTEHGFVWGDEWIEYDSEWSTMPRIPQLWLQVFTWIAPRTGACSPASGSISSLLPIDRPGADPARCAYFPYPAA